jgi:hypothetical protein
MVTNLLGSYEYDLIHLRGKFSHHYVISSACDPLRKHFFKDISLRKFFYVTFSVVDIQGGPTLTIFAITRFLIIEKILRLARKRHTLWSYKPVPLFYLLSIGFRVKRR